MARTGQEFINVEQVGGVCVVTILLHELGATECDEFTTHLLNLLNEPKSKRFLLDFGSVRYMESACFEALVTFLKWLSRFDGKIALANVSENVRFLFAITKLDKVFPLYGDVPSALQFLEK